MHIKFIIIQIPREILKRERERKRREKRERGGLRISDNEVGE